jgi:tetratricopeptide (TPR) repeat protein
VVLPYRAEAFVGPQALLSLHRQGGRGGARAALEGRLVEELKRQAALRTTYDLASGLAAAEISAAVIRALQGITGGGTVRVVLERAELSPEVQASFEREAIYGRRVETGARVLLVGIDGADWDVIEPLIAAGRLPNLARLRGQGAWARLRSFVPALSPILWTTVATGKSPDRHGINDFLVDDPRTGRRVLMNSTFRRVRALWNILSEAGLENDVIAWWATWPAESIRGHLVSDRVAYSTFNLGLQDQGGAVHPPAYADAVGRLRVSEESITFAQVSHFLHLSEGEFRRARAAAARQAAGGGAPPPGGGPTETQESINVFVRVLAATETYRKVALDLLDRRAREGTPARLFAVYFQGIDEVSHRFAHCAPPRSTLCPPGDYARFKDAVASFYRHQDEILGDILRRASGTDVLLVSDHGFASGANRPPDVKPFIEGRPGLWHDLIGVFLAQGPSIRRGEIPTVTLYDIAPTILHLLGLPVPEDMPGRVIEAMLKDEFTAGRPVARVPSYEGLGPPGERPGGAPLGEAAAALEDAAGEEIVAQLRALGYIGGGEGEATTAPSEGGVARPAPQGGAPPAGVPTLLYHTNLGTTYLGKRQFDLAEAEFRKALRIHPRAPQALTGMAVLQEARGEPEKALETLRAVAESEDGVEPTTILKLADLFVRLGRPADGVPYLEGLGRRLPEGTRLETARQVGLGMLYSATGRARDAETALVRALSLDPTSEQAMQELFPLLDAQGRASELEPRIRVALAQSPDSAMHRIWLGLVLKRRGDLKRSEAEFRKVLGSRSERAAAGAMANLGTLYLEQGRVDEAVAILRSAVERDPQSLESRTNLIVALGMAHDLEGARGQVREAEARGERHPRFYNALAYVLHLHRLDREALEAVRESLRLDPRQGDALRLRDEIETGQAAAGSPYR